MIERNEKQDEFLLSGLEMFMCLEPTPEDGVEKHNEWKECFDSIFKAVKRNTSPSLDLTKYEVYRWVNKMEINNE